jgi:GntR family transcriptional regulator
MIASQDMSISSTESKPIDFSGVINHHSPVPYYFQLSRYIEEKIKSRELRPGQILPSEQELCEKMRVSRTVVRQAMTELEHKGIITKQSGKRSIIAMLRYEASLMQNFVGFYEDAVSKGRMPRTQVLELRAVSAEDEVSTALGLNVGEAVIRLRRIRFLDGEPEILSVTHVVEKKCPSLIHEDFTNQSLYGILDQKYGLVITKGLRTIRAIALDRIDAKVFGLRAGSPALLVTSVGLLQDGTPLEYFVSIYRGDRSQFQVWLTRKAGDNTVEDSDARRSSS